MALHNEHLRKADESYEIRHDNNGNAIHVFIKDGEAIVFPTLWDLIRYEYLGDSYVERFYLNEHELTNLYGSSDYSYYRLKQYHETALKRDKYPFVQDIEFAHNKKLIKISFIVNSDDQWIVAEGFDIHYCEHYNDIEVYTTDSGKVDIVHSQKISFQS
jgi:hypothetical protein